LKNRRILPVKWGALGGKWGKREHFTGFLLAENGKRCKFVETINEHGKEI
jgi:hypothetical protein